MKDREIACKYYEYEGHCLKGREGLFLKTCQKCNKYVPLLGSAPRRTDNRRHKIEKQMRKELKY